MRLSEIYAPMVIKDRDDIGSNPTANRPMIDIIETRLSRRFVLGGLAAGGAFGIYGGMIAGRVAIAEDPSVDSDVRGARTRHRRNPSCRQGLFGQGTDLLGREYIPGFAEFDART